MAQNIYSYTRRENRVIVRKYRTKVKLKPSQKNTKFCSSISNIQNLNFKGPLSLLSEPSLYWTGVVWRLLVHFPSFQILEITTQKLN